MANQPCCESNLCDLDLSCVAAVGGMRCRPCGGVDEPCCPGARCLGGGVCQGNGRCAPMTPACGLEGGACCAGRTCGPSLACVDRSEAMSRDAAVDAMELDASDAAVDADDVEDAGMNVADDALDASDAAADATDASDDALDASDAEVDVADASDAGVDASDAEVDVADADPGVCVSCGGFNEPCCASDECLLSLSCQRHDAGVARCLSCGRPGEPCCPGARACSTGALCVPTRDDAGVCEVPDGG